MPRGSQPPYYEIGTPEYAAYEVGKSDGKLSGLKSAQRIVAREVAKYTGFVQSAGLAIAMSALRRAGKKVGK